MISFLRKGLSSWLVLAILGLVMIAFVVTGVASPGGSPLAGGGQRLVSVGDESVSSVEIADQVNRQLERLRQQQPELDIGAFFREGAFEEIVRQVIGQKALLVFGREQGLAASKRMVDAEIASIPAFQNLAGRFDQATFQQALQGERMTEQDLRRDIESGLIARQLLIPVQGSPFVPQEMAVQYANLLLEQRSGSVGLVPAAVFATAAPPTEAEVAAFYRQNQGRYTIPERRVLRYAAFGPDQVAAQARATEAEVQAFYRANAARYGAKETRTLSQVVLPDQAAARAFAAKLAAGTSFAQAAQQAGFSEADTRIGDQDRAQLTRLTSPAVANAAFGAAEGAATAPVQSPLGWHVVRVDAIKRTAATPVEAVRGEIEQQIGQQKAQEALATLVTRIEDALGGGASLEEVARTERLQLVETPPLTATGQNPGAAGWQIPPDVQPLLSGLFQMEPDEDPTVEAISPGRYAIVAPGRVIAAAPPPLAQIRELVAQDLVRQRASEQARAVANTIVGRINGGMPAAQAFAGAGVRLPAVERVSSRRIDIARPGQPVPPPLAMMFSLARGKARLLEAPNGQGWFVVHLETTVPGNAAGQTGLIQATRTQFQGALGDEYAAQFNRAVQSGLKVERDEAAITQVKRQLQSGQPVQ
nr:peptidylprolyl isomerase [uncultured Sphingosinicella sp.]